MASPSSPSSLTRIAVAGAGTIGRAHIQALAASAASRLCAVIDPSPAAAEVARAAGVPLYPSLAAALAAEQPDGVVLATPNALHLPQALECIAAGIPVLVEKPLAASVEEGEQLVRAAATAGVPVLVGHHRAHSAVMQAAREVIAQGRLGELVAVTGSALFFKPDAYFAEAPWRRAPGGGPILINMIHEVHNLRMLCGEIAEVQAMRSKARRGFEVEDSAAVILRFTNGALGTFILSDCAASTRSWEQTSGENPAYARSDEEDCYLVAGSMGSLAVPSMRLTFHARAQDRSWYEPMRRQQVPLAARDPIASQMAHFDAVVRGQARPLVSAADGLANLRVVEAIVQAACSACTVHLSGDAGPA